MQSYLIEYTSKAAIILKLGIGLCIVNLVMQYSMDGKLLDYGKGTHL